MNHKKHYDLLVQKAQQRPKLTGYVERHHIVPKAMSGSDDATNLVALTAREHCLAHLLLAHIYDSEEMWFAANMMSRLHRITSRAYETAKIKRSKLMRERMIGANNPMFNNGDKCHLKGKSGEKHPMFGRKNEGVTKRLKQMVGDKNHMTGRFGEKHHNFKGYVVATNIKTGEQMTFKNRNEIKDFGFHAGHVGSCITGKLKTHKGHTFKRIDSCQ